jgi:hypothetical protein
MERHRHDGIDFARPVLRVVDHHRAERSAELTVAIVLETLNRIGNGAAVLEDRAGAGYRFEEDGAGGAEDRRAVSRLVTACAAQRGEQGEEAF